MPEFYDPDINRNIVFDVAANFAPWLRIYSGGHDGFQAAAWVDKAIGDPNSAAPGTCEIIPYRGWGADTPSGTGKMNLYALHCKDFQGKKWEIVVDWDGNGVNGWATAPGDWALPGSKPA